LGKSKPFILLSIQKIIEGDEFAFRKFYELTFTKVYHFVLKHTRDKTLAEDLVQIAYLQLWQKRSKIQPALPALKAYLYTTCRNLVIKEYRRRIAEREVAGLFGELHRNESSPAEENPQLLAQIRCAVDKLPTQQQQAFRLVKFEGLTYREAALRMAISESTLEKHIIKALQNLRHKLSELAFRILL
jgi:RNA polymerase sigma-70 factor (ECF subfamily)